MSLCRHPSFSLWRDVPPSVNSSAVTVAVVSSAPWDEQQKRILIGLKSRPSAVVNSSAAISSSSNFATSTHLDRRLSSREGGRFSCASALAAAATKHSPPPPAAYVGGKEVEEEEEAEDEGKDEDEEDDWESEIFQGFKDRRRDGGYRTTGSVEEEAEEDKVSKVRKEEEKMVDWSTKARERAVKAIQARGLPTARVLGEDQEKKKKRRRRRKKKKKLAAAAAASAAAAVESRVAEEKTIPMTAAGGVPDERHLSGDPHRMDRVREIPPHMMKALGSGEGFQQQLSGVANYWRSLGNTAVAAAGGAAAAADVAATRLGNGAREFSDRVVTPAVRKASSIPGGGGGSRGHLAPSRQKRQEDFELNRKLVGAADATEVLTLVGGVLENGYGAGVDSECPLSPFNVSTSLHRIAKHMESTSMSKSDRLAFARRRAMAQLVSAAIESLPNCSAQSVSNIAWALSKVGGYSLYGPEVDRLADVAVSKISELEPQHVANIAGALASMQHSVPTLFQALERRAASHHRYFQSQELAQLLWAFATLNQPAALLLDALDSECRNDPRILTPASPSGSASPSVPVPTAIEEESVSSSPVLADAHVPLTHHRNLIYSFLSNGDPEHPDSEDKNVREEEKSELAADAQHESSNSERLDEEESGSLLLLKEKSNVQVGMDAGAKIQGLNSVEEDKVSWVSGKKYFESSSLSQLASLSWSYTVLGQLDRPSFALIWKAISSHGQATSFRVSDLPCPRLQLSQLHQTKLSLQLEFPALNLNLSLGQPLESLAREEWESIKSGLKSTSVAQLDVERLLAGMGQRWVAEYTALDYSVDAALVERKIGLEIDGPSHFARNTGAPLGHTVLKRRHLAAAGWTILSIPYQEWDEQVGEKEQARYVHNLLEHYL